MFADIEKPDFQIKIKEIDYWTGKIVFEDKTDFYNYVWAKINEFTIFFYIFVFFLFVFIFFLFIKNMLSKN